MQKKGSNSSLKQDTISLRNFLESRDRREYLERKLNLNLQNLESNDIEKNSDVHCENLIGATTIPLGVFGPLLLKGEKVNGERYVPLATTEGALVASVNRGAKAIYENGGVIVRARLAGQTRGPVFNTLTIEKGLIFKDWLLKNKDKISKTAGTSSTHIKFLDFKIKIIGGNTFVRFVFDTDKAMGMNMVTIATEKIVKMIEKETKIKCIAVAGNFDIDKKPAYLNLIEGRGYEVWAECLITKKILNEVLKTTAEDVYTVWLSKVMIGSYASGSLGFNSHFANIIAAIFLATGQDSAHVVEGSCGITTCEVAGENLYISINLPSLIIGIIGGGTKLPTQKAALSIMGIKDKSATLEFAEIIAGSLLSGELSLLSALSTNTLGSAHKNLGRSKK